MSPPELKVDDLFHDCRALKSEAERRAYLDRACRGDSGLRARVEALLAADAAASVVFLEPISARSSTTGAAASEAPGTVIGHYELLDKIGEGGFGTVWMAEQKEPVKRRVALKILKLGMDTKQVVARFDQERQALALMDHPNIARVFDAGATETGRPYFVMELVKGVPMLEYCDGERLDTQARLALFVDVCHAIQHAHQKGIIHRDIKPSNVLVTMHDGKPVPKVIDFGIAKATSAELTAMTLFTEHRQILGTPAYMSPEQAEMTDLDIDTRSDIYSLGVLLYELLTGTTPFDVRELLQQGFAEMMRVIKEVDPHKPSTRVSTMGDTATETAERRSIKPRKLSVLLRGDLDWIVMRCLEKDRTRRYESASGLALDVQRHLSGEAVEAAPPSAAYRFRKFIRRNKGAAITTSIVAAALVAGLIGTLWQANIAEQERDIARHEAARADERAIAAEKAEAEARRLAISEAEQRAEAQKQRAAAEESARAEKARAEELKQVSEFQAKMLADIDPTEAGLRLGRDLRERFDAALAKTGASQADRDARAQSFARDLAQVNSTDAAAKMIDSTILAPAVAAVASQFKDQPVVDASLRQTLAELFATLGLYDEAQPLQESALATRRRVLGEEHPDTLSSINDMGHLLELRGKRAETEPFYREALEKRRRALGEEHPETLSSMSNLGNLLRSLGRPDEAEPLVRDSLAIDRRVLGNEHRDTLICLNIMGYLRIDQGRLKEAEPYWREAYETGKRVLGADDKDTLVFTNNMGGLMNALGRPKEAEQFYREAYEATRRVRGEEHPSTLSCVSNLAATLSKEGLYAEAEKLLVATLAARRRTLGSDHPDTLGTLFTLGSMYRDQRKLDEAEKCLRECYYGRRRVLGEQHPDTISSLIGLAKLSLNTGKLSEAESTYRTALESSRSIWSDDHPDRLIALNDLGNVLVQEKKFDEARTVLEDVVARRRRVYGEDHPETLIARSNLAALKQDTGDLTAAEADFRDLLQRFRRVRGNEHPNTLICMSRLSSVLREQKRFAECEPLDLEVVASSQRTFGPDHSFTAQAHAALGQTLTGLKRYADAESELVDAEHVLGTQANAPPGSYRKCLEALVALYTAWNEAEPSDERATHAAEWKAQLDALPQTKEKR
jgi:serine/threonine protein kinase